MSDLRSDAVSVMRSPRLRAWDRGSTETYGSQVGTGAKPGGDTKFPEITPKRIEYEGGDPPPSTRSSVG